MHCQAPLPGINSNLSRQQNLVVLLLDLTGKRCHKPPRTRDSPSFVLIDGCHQAERSLYLSSDRIGLQLHPPFSAGFHHDPSLSMEGFFFLCSFPSKVLFNCLILSYNYFGASIKISTIKNKFNLCKIYNINNRKQLAVL